jgi:hypothetical protein
LAFIDWFLSVLYGVFVGCCGSCVFAHSVRCAVNAKFGRARLHIWETDTQSSQIASCVDIPEYIPLVIGHLVEARG